MKKIFTRALRVIKNPWRIFNFVRNRIFHLFSDQTLNDGERFDPTIFKLFGLADEASLARYHFARKMIGRTEEILDIACGTGYGTLMLADICQKITGVDINAQAISFARQKYQKQDHINFLVGNLMDNKISADCLVSFETVEHLTDDLAIVLTKLVSCCRHKMILSVPYQETPGHNRHHCKFQLSEQDFAILAQTGSVRFFYQTLNGLITNEPNEMPETLIVVWEKADVTKTMNEQ